MKLYHIQRTGEWTGTKAEAQRLAARARATFDLVDVPTDKDGLLAFLNSREAGVLHDDVLVYAVEDAPATGQGELVITPMQAPPPPPDMARPAIVAQEISVEEAIAGAGYPRALRLAEHVHCRLMEHARAAGGAA